MREDNIRLREKLAERLGALSQNAIELKNISNDIANFKNILMGNKQARGTFGERQLEDLVRDIMPPETYAFQSVLETGVRPDCIIRLPYPPGDMIIDSKFPLESYNRMLPRHKHQEFCNLHIFRKFCLTLSYQNSRTCYPLW